MKRSTTYINKTLYVLVIVALTGFSQQLMAQEFNIGIRAGQNYSTIRGPLETGESFGYKGGFHFGLSFQYNISNWFGIKTEFLYNQNGFEQNFVGEGYYLIRRREGVTFERGNLDQRLRVSNAYITFPITAQFKINRRWEVYGGVYAAVLVGPTGNGILNFDSIENPDEIFFKQSLEYNYSSDIAGGFRNGNIDPVIKVLDELVTIPKIAQAYYQYLDKDGNLFNRSDFGLNAGINYYLNRGFYVGLRMDYGMRDITRTQMDRSFIDLDEDNSIFQRDDKDTNLGYQVSLGFKF